ncbi:MAG: UvrD-helicase domain-containing protein [Deltaproteobacteria bacterium]|nr:UvrD-helicase domain-containing protein [Deltaproteobacteria bacterium]MBW2136488.1 UvrD-helicase domain-containing protein [Deltaproteobacteria bacterium]
MLENKIEYDKVLNPAQLEAVMTLEGPVLVIAGAGSGKTRTLVYRVARLVEVGVAPENILLLTFTRKAAGEMLERAAGLADERCRRVSGGTFHSLAYRVLRSHAGLLGFHDSFTILDRSDMEEVVYSLARDMQVQRRSIRFPKRSTLTNILSKSANLQTGTEEVLRLEYPQFLEYTQEIGRLASLYKGFKRDNQLMDYDDLLIFFRQLLTENTEIRKRLGVQYRYIMVDEYQDTNAIQADIVKWMAEDHHNVMVVGDDSQSIYSFRGANYRNMFEFPGLFPEVKTIKLEENYRSTQPILTLTNALMEQALESYTKCLFTKRSGGEMPRVIDTGTEPEQALFICRSIQDLKKKGQSIRDIAVLFRAAYHSFELEMELNRQGIPYVKYGGFKFLESAHIKDLLSHLRVVVNRDDAISWGRVLRLIKNIGQSKSQSIIDWMKEERCHSWQIDQWPGLGKGDGGLGKLAELLKALSAEKLKPEQAVRLVLDYYEPILMEKYDDFPRRYRELEQLISMASRYKGIRSFLDDLIMEPPNSPSELKGYPKRDSLTLSTVHSAKGLEWASVFIIWVMDGFFPPARAHSNRESLEEERRLMYVATTRAKDHLFLCYPSQEAPRSWSNTDYDHALSSHGFAPSSFIQALPGQVVEYCSYRTGMREPVEKWLAKGQEKMPEKGARSYKGLRPGDKVRHPAFGHGVVSKFLDKEKVEVLFRNFGRKLLHLGYTTLEKV